VVQRSLLLESEDYSVELFTGAREFAGMLNKQIASQFGTTEGTIKVHRGRVMEKTGATSVAELVILAQRARIAPASSDATKV
jgi:Bacterial regulatory proteins, luxR family